MIQLFFVSNLVSIFTPFSENICCSISSKNLNMVFRLSNLMFLWKYFLFISFKNYKRILSKCSLHFDHLTIFNVFYEMIIKYFFFKRFVFWYLIENHVHNIRKKNMLGMGSWTGVNFLHSHNQYSQYNSMYVRMFIN